MKPNHVNQGEMQDTDMPNMDVVAIAYFEQLMAKERRKPVDEQDFDLIDECIKNIAELKGVRSEFTEDEIEQKLGALLTRSAENEDVAKDQIAPDPVLHVRAKKRTVRFRPLIAAVVAIALLVAGCLTAYATVPSFRNWVLKLLDMPVGSSIENQNISYVYKGKITEYQTVFDLSQNEELQVLFPSVLPENVYITEIKRVDTESVSNYLFIFSDTTINYMATTNFYGTIESEADYQTHHIGEITSYYWYDELVGCYMAMLVHENCYYSISAQSIESLILILDNMKGVQ